MSLTANKTSTMAATLTHAAAFGGDSTFAFSATQLSSALTSGTGADKADQFYPAQFTLGAGEALSLNLSTMASNGLTAPTDPNGSAMAFATLKQLTVQSRGNLGCGYVSAAALNAAGSGYTNGAQVLTLVGGLYLGSVVIHSAGGGSGYAVGDVLTMAGGTGTAATAKVLTVSGGAILTLAVLTRGAYSVTPTVTSNAATGGSGTGASLDLTVLSGTAAQIAVLVAGNVVNSVISVSVPGSYIALPPTTACAVTGGGGTGCTLNLTLGTRVAGDAVFTAGDNLTLGNVGTTAGWTSVLSPNTATYTLRAGTSNLPGTWELADGGSTGYVVGTSTTNNILKFTNAGSNPVTFQLLATGATA